MNAKMKTLTPLLFAGASAAAIALAPTAAAEPPAPCTNPDGTACEVVTPDGAHGCVPVYGCRSYTP